MTGKYDNRFFDSILAGSRRSAEIVFDHLAPLFAATPASLVDVGCGTGTWARVFAERFGTRDVRGIDGDYVDRSQLLIDASQFSAHDLTRPLPVDRRFGLAMSLEVGEHLPTAAAPGLVKILVDHADHVLFSAAIPGQGGEYHVNEQPLDYWRALFRREGYVAVDCLRPALHRNRAVEPWYRYNAVLYVRADRVAALPEPLRTHVVPEDRPLPDYASAWWRLRCGLISLLPASIVLRLARIKRRAIRIRPAGARTA